jgi:hypothetical protein
MLCVSIYVLKILRYLADVADYQMSTDKGHCVTLPMTLATKTFRRNQKRYELVHDRF